MVSRPERNNGSSADWLPFVEDQLRAIGQLSDDWDRHGASPVRPEVLDVARELVRSLADAPEVTRPHVNPTPAGGVQFEWEEGGRYLEIEVTAEKTARYFFEDSAIGRVEEREIIVSESMDHVVELVACIAVHP